MELNKRFKITKAIRANRVYLAIDQVTQKPVVIKIAPHHEAKILKALVGPFVPSLVDYGQCELGDFLALEYLDGISLGQLIQPNSQMGALAALSLFKPVLVAIDAIHRSGIIHLDLKPSNIYFAKQADDTNQVKIIDFGTARSTNVTAPKAQKPIGTAGFASPEQIRGEAIDLRSDIYSLGAILSWLLTGISPFKGNRPSEIFAEQLASKIQNLNLAPLGDNPKLRRVIEKAMAFEAKNRFASAQEFLAALQASIPAQPQ